jgi:hypothetical protein
VRAIASRAATTNRCEATPPRPVIIARTLRTVPLGNPVDRAATPFGASHEARAESVRPNVITCGAEPFALACTRTPSGWAVGSTVPDGDHRGWSPSRRDPGIES